MADKGIVLSPRAASEQLARGITDAEAEQLAGQLLSSFGAERLARGAHAVEDTTVLFAVQAQGDSAPELVTRTYAEDGAVWSEWTAPKPDPRPDLFASGSSRHAMARLGDSALWAAALALPNFSATAYRFEQGPTRIGGDWVALEHYLPEPECLPQDSVPKGTVTEYVWESTVFPGTVRGYWLYVPAHYEPAGPPLCLMVFQDGGMYLEPPAPVPTILDHLIHQGQVPAMAALFVNPGTFRDQPGRFQNRSFEYDTLSDQYARFLRDELLPHVGSLVHLRDDPQSRGIGGISSGAACAFTAAWQMPELFGKVLCHVGSFTNIRGAHAYWSLVRQTPRKPIRVYLQDGTNDIDDACGNWFLANQELAAALRFMGYDVRTEWGRGFHSLAHGGATLPSALRWLWADPLRVE